MSAPKPFQNILFVPPAGPAGPAAADIPTRRAPQWSIGAAVESPPAPRGRARGDAGAMHLCVLGSGSSGNCTAVRRPAPGGGEDLLLIDAGFGPRAAGQRLHQAGAALENVRAICVTHLDHDHYKPNWTRTLLQLRITLYLHHWHIEQFERLAGSARLVRAGLLQVFDQQPFAPLPHAEAPACRVTPVNLPHDEKGTIGFRLDSEGGSLGYATDLGHVPPQLVETFASDGGVDVLAIESNYDPQLQVASPRPMFLKRRIMGKLGHLSNQESFEAVRRIADRSPAGRPGHVVLLHRSRQCNCPTIVRELFAQDPRFAGRVTLSEQGRRTPWLAVAPRRGDVQMNLFA